VRREVGELGVAGAAHHDGADPAGREVGRRDQLGLGLALAQLEARARDQQRGLAEPAHVGQEDVARVALDLLVTHRRRRRSRG
jgi:hypothetical protein